MFLKCVYLLLCSTSPSLGANILALVPAVSYSHHVAYAPLWKELSLRGHNVTLLTAHPDNNPKLTNLTELDINWVYKFIPNVSHVVEFEITMWNFQTSLYTIMNDVCDGILSSDVGQTLLDVNNNFDVVLVENVCPEFLAFADMYNCPKIMFASMSLASIFYNILGDFTHPISHPEFVVPFHGQMTFRERLTSLAVSSYLHYTFLFNIFPKRQTSLRIYFNRSSTIPELVRDIDMLFLNVNPHIQGPRAFGPATITIGGHREDMSLKPIPKDVKTFLDDAIEGCILVSLGSNIKSSQISKSLLKAIIEGLGEVPFKVLLKFEAKATNMPKNIKIDKWLPQQKILNHPNLKLFVSHGGLQSIEESIYGEVPFVIIPFFADQYQNGRILENKGIGVILDRNTLTKYKLKNAIMEVIHNPKYYERVKKLKKIILDEPMTGLQKAVWWTEYVIRNKGAKHLKNPAADIPLYQYLLLDVIGFLLVIVILIVSALLVTLKKISRLYRTFYHKKEKSI